MKEIKLEGKPTEVKVMWSKKYCMPVYLVEGKLYAPETGEYAGYYHEIPMPKEETNGTA